MSRSQDGDKVGLYLMTRKGLLVLTELLSKFGPESIVYVVSAPDVQVEKDYYDEIEKLCLEKRVPFYNRKDQYDLNNPDTINFSIGWRWLISNTKNLIIIHDSLLPVYRGFSPVVTALINGDKKLGVTALFANEQYDRGDIIAQETIDINYPIKISEAIDKLSHLYAKIVCDIYSHYLQGRTIESTPQDESMATYSVWRDEKDYFIDWHKNAEYIKRVIDALGFPYLGAKSLMNGEQVIINEAEVEKDIVIEDRENCIGKVMQLANGVPIVICKEGLLRLLSISYCNSGSSAIPLKKLRTRFE